MNPGLIAREQVYSVLRTNLPSFAIACIILASGILTFALMRLRSRDRLLLWVGTFSILYAVRLLVQNELVRDAFNSPGPGYLPIALCITYAINIPFTLFVRELLGRGWNGTIVLWLWLSVAFAIVAIPITVVAPTTAWVSPANSVFVVAGTVLILLHVTVGRRSVNPLAASLVWPLLIFGVFVFMENEGVRIAGISIEPVGFLALLAGLASIAVRRALATERKLIDVEQELSTARRIQGSIIPQSPPVIPGLRLAARYQPMTAVAGDFYDFLKSSDHLLTILVADVSGHGVPAALISCMLKVCFEAQRERACDPAAILSGLNVMLGGSLGGQYVTAACAAIDRNTQTVTYSGAGHPPTLLVCGNTGQITLLAENGLFLGPFPKASYTNMSVPFQAGDRLFLYTDGITESQDASGDEFGRERLEEFLSRSSGDPATTLTRLFDRITTTTQQDDLTGVLVYCD